MRLDVTGINSKKARLRLGLQDVKDMYVLVRDGSTGKRLVD
jgi:hypothetical protein